MKWISHVVERILIVLAVLFFLQIPLFMVAYQHQLLGHIHELHWQVEAMENSAKQTDQSMTGYIHKFVSNSDRDFSNQGKIMNQIYLRWKRFTVDYEALQKASTVTKPFVFIYHLDYEIAKSTLHAFQAGLLLNGESLIYAGVGMLFGIVVFTGLKVLLLTCLVRRSRLSLNEV